MKLIYSKILLALFVVARANAVETPAPAPTTSTNSAASLPASLTLADARKLALKNHPRLSAADFKALAAQQGIAQSRAAFLPSFTANLTAASTPETNTRLGAGGLNVPTVFERAGAGLVVNQLLTDFGRTADLVETSRLRARAENEVAQAARNLLLLQVTASFYHALQAQSVLAVARQTLTNRQVLLDQVSALAKNQLKSDLDVSFARVNFEEARLLIAKSDNDLRAAQFSLTTLLGSRDAQVFTLGEPPLPESTPEDVAALVAAALARRPELARLRAERDAAVRFARAEKGLAYPTVSAVGSIGSLPIRDPRLPEHYAAAGVNVSIPLFNGGLNAARRTEAELKARAAEENLRDEENNLIRDVRIAHQHAAYAHERLDLTAKLHEHARIALNLAQTRYQLGATSIGEFNRTQLNQTTAEIAVATAKYDYLIQRAILDFQTGAR